MSSIRVKYIPVYMGGRSRKGHGIGATFKGWLNRTIPIIKSKVGTTAKKMGKDMAGVALDAAYTASKDMLHGNKGQLIYNQVDDDNFNFTTPINTRRPPKKAIKRKARSKPVSHIQNVKCKRPN